MSVTNDHAANDGVQAKDGVMKMIDRSKTYVAWGLVALWVVGLFVLWQFINDDARWPRILVVFHSIEAAAFAALSVLLGVQVKRTDEAQKAEGKAKADLVQEKGLNEIAEDLANKVLSEKGHTPLTIGPAMLSLDKDRTEKDASVELAQHFLAARRAVNRRI